MHRSGAEMLSRIFIFWSAAGYVTVLALRPRVHGIPIYGLDGLNDWDENNMPKRSM